MAVSPKISIDKTEAQFRADEASYLETVISQGVITPESQNVETGLLQTLQGRLSTAFLNVFEFGVVGSGDDTTAMQAAFTAGGDTVYFIPPGTYSLTGDITATAGSVVFLAGVTLSGGDIVGTDLTLIGSDLFGDFVGPAVAVDGNLVAFDGTTGKLGKDAAVSASQVVVHTAPILQSRPSPSDVPPIDESRRCVRIFAF